ncbi:MAG: hypothetical protein WBN90_02530 [Gammaproteobacteria bacterium]
MANAAAFMKISDLFLSLESFLKKTGQIYSIDQPVAGKSISTIPYFKDTQKRKSICPFFSKKHASDKDCSATIAVIH